MRGPRPATSTPPSSWSGPAPSSSSDRGEFTALARSEQLIGAAADPRIGLLLGLAALESGDLGRADELVAAAGAGPPGDECDDVAVLRRAVTIRASLARGRPDDVGTAARAIRPEVVEGPPLRAPGAHGARQRAGGRRARPGPPRRHRGAGPGRAPRLAVPGGAGPEHPGPRAVPGRGPVGIPRPRPGRDRPRDEPRLGPQPRPPAGPGADGHGRDPGRPPRGRPHAPPRRRGRRGPRAPRRRVGPRDAARRRRPRHRPAARRLAGHAARADGRRRPRAARPRRSPSPAVLEQHAALGSRPGPGGRRGHPGRRPPAGGVRRGGTAPPRDCCG